MLREVYGDGYLVLADYFDFVGGTGSGAILAAFTSLGMSTDQMKDFFEEWGPEMFAPGARVNRPPQGDPHDDPLAQKLQRTFGKDTELGADSLRTLLMMVLCDDASESPYCLTNNPRAPGVAADGAGEDRKLKLWQLAHASVVPSANPSLLPGARRHPDDSRGDGGAAADDRVTLPLFRQATLATHEICWTASEDQMLIVSVGSGYTPDGKSNRTPLGANAHLFTHLSYDAELSPLGLKQLDTDLESRSWARMNLAKLDPASLDSLEKAHDLRRIGRAIGTGVNRSHFAGFLGERDG